MKRLPPSFQPQIRRFAAFISVATVLVLALVACGGGGDATPTPALLPTTEAQVPVATPRPGEITVGNLADRIAAAWPTVITIRQTSSTTMDSATPEASPTTSTDYVITTEVDASGSKRITITALGFELSQLISIRGQIWALGYQAWQIPESAVGPDIGGGWVEVNTSATQGDASFNQLVLNLLSNFPVVYSGLDATARARVVESVGNQTIDGRICSTYRIPQTTETGQAYDTFVSLDESGLPCSIVTEAFGQTQTSTYEFNTPIEISPPSATPSASPVAAD